MAEGTASSRCSAWRLGVGLGGLVETRLEVDDRDEPVPRPGVPPLRQRRPPAGPRGRRGDSSGDRTFLTPGTLAISRVAAAPLSTAAVSGEVGTGHLHRQRLERGLALRR